MEEKYTYTIGRRKTSVATVRLFDKPGKNTINGKPVEVIYTSKSEAGKLIEPFMVAELENDKYSFTAVCKGGGRISQLEAVCLGLSRAIAKKYPEKKKALKLKSLLTRDPRMVERKKPGLHKARKAEQYSKR